MSVLRLSTALMNQQFGYQRAFVGTTYELVNATSRLTASGNNLITDGLRPTDVVTISGSTSGNDGYWLVNSVQPDGSYATLAVAPVNESANANLTITVSGKGLLQTLKYGLIVLYGGTMPADADAAEGASPLVLITTSSGALTVGTSTNGLELAAPSGGAIAKSGVWSGVGILAGTITWGRYYDNGYITGVDAAEKAIRFDGNAATSGAFFVCSTTSVTVGKTITVDSFDLTHLGG